MSSAWRLSSTFPAVAFSTVSKSVLKIAETVTRAWAECWSESATGEEGLRGDAASSRWRQQGSASRSSWQHSVDSVVRISQLKVGKRAQTGHDAFFLHICHAHWSVTHSVFRIGLTTGYTRRFVALRRNYCHDMNVPTAWLHCCQQSAMTVRILQMRGRL